MNKFLQNKLTIAGLLLIALILINIIATAVPWRLDLTAGKFYTLSPGSRELIKKIDPRDPIEITFYYAASLPQVPILFKNYAERIRGLLEQYASVSRGKIRLRVVDPRPDTQDEEKAIRAGVQAQPLPSGENFFLGLVVSQAEQTQTLPFFNPQRESLLEYDISQLIARVQRESLPKLGIITGLPLFGRGSPAMRNAQPDWVVIDELRKSFSVVPLSDKIPNDIDVLAVIHPVGLSQDTLYEIDQFLLSGRPVFVAVDPSSVFTKQNPTGGQTAFALGLNVTSDLPALFSAYGIVYESQQVVADTEYAALVNTDPGQPPVPYAVWLDVRNFPEESAATASLRRAFFAEAGSVKLSDNSPLTLTPLIKSSKNSRLIDQSRLQFTVPSELITMVLPGDGPHIIGGIFRGKFSTAFPGGRPAPPPPAEGETPQPTPEPGTHLKESAQDGTLIVIADTDFLADAFSVQVFNFFGQRAIQPLNDNLALAANTLELLGGSPDLIALRGKGQVARPFERILAMEVKAQQEFQKQLSDLDARLQTIRNELENLTREQRNQGVLALSPQVQAKIDDFRAQEANVRRQQREIRKRLREDIEYLNITLATLNLLLVPVLLAGFGFWFFRSRAARQKTVIKEET